MLNDKMKNSTERYAALTLSRNFLQAHPPLDNNCHYEAKVAKEAAETQLSALAILMPQIIPKVNVDFTLVSSLLPGVGLGTLR